MIIKKNYVLIIFFTLLFTSMKVFVSRVFSAFRGNEAALEEVVRACIFGIGIAFCLWFISQKYSIEDQDSARPPEK